MKRYYDKEGFEVSGFVSKLMVSSIHLSKAHLRKLNAITKKFNKAKGQKTPPKYAITLGFGNRFEPYIVDIKKAP